MEAVLSRFMHEYRTQYVMQGQDPALHMHNLVRDIEKQGKFLHWLELYFDDVMRFPPIPFALTATVLLTTVVVPLMLVAHFCCDHAKTCLGRTRLCCMPQSLDKSTSLPSLA